MIQSTLAVRSRRHGPVITSCLLALTLFAALGAGPVAAAFTLEQVRGYAFPDMLVAASRGAQIAWVVDDHGRRNVWVATAPEFSARQLTAYTQDDGQELSSLRISADGANVVYVRGGEHGANWEGGLPADPQSLPDGARVEIWSVAFAGGAPRLLAEGDDPVISPDNRRVAFLKDKTVWVAPIDGSVAARRLFKVRGDTASLRWSPDGSRLAFVSSRQTHSLIGIFTDDLTPILWLAPSVTRDVSPRWSPDGKRIAFVRLAGEGGVPTSPLRFAPRPWAIWSADASSGVAQQRWASGKTLRDSYYRGYLDWAAQDRIVFQSYRDGWQHLYSLPAADGEPMLLTAGNYMVEDIALSADKQYLVFNANTGGDADDIDRRHLFKVPVDKATMEALTLGTGLEWSPVIAGDGSLVFFSATAQRPPMLATLQKQGGAIRLLHGESLLASYPTQQLVVPKRVTFTAADGVVAHGQLFEPRASANKDGGKHAALVYIHGGPQWQMFLGWNPLAYHSNYYALNQYLASRGYVVLAVNYRLGIGYGHDFHFPPAGGSRGGAEYQDIHAAGRYLQALPSVDARRVGLYGGSYGGYLTAMGLARNSDLFVAGVDIHGVHNWADAHYSGALTLRQGYEAIPDAEQALRIAWNSSPVASVSSWRSPVLFIHGDDDRNVQFGQTVDLMRRLEGTGVHQESIVLVDETHSMQRYANALRTNQATAEFLERYLGIASEHARH